MSSDRDRLQSLVDALPDTDVQVAISLLAELGEQEIIDAETAARLDLARTEPGDDVPLEEVRRLDPVLMDLKSCGPRSVANNATLL